MTEQVRKEIKKRKELNRQQRNKNREREKIINLRELQRTKNISERTNKKEI